MYQFGDAVKFYSLARIDKVLSLNLYHIANILILTSLSQEKKLEREIQLEELHFSQFYLVQRDFAIAISFFIFFLNLFC